MKVRQPRLHRWVWPEEDREAVRGHHREIRCRFYPQDQAMILASLWRLAEQGYGQDEVAVMLGVSRERVRQFANQVPALADLFRALGKGTKPRVWDPERGCFMAVTRASAVEAQHEAQHAVRRATLRARQKAGRREAVALLRSLAEKLGRTPTLAEMNDHLPAPWQSYARRFTGRTTAMGPGFPWRSCTRRWLRLAGLRPRGRGQHGHVDPTAVQRARYPRRGLRDLRAHRAWRRHAVATLRELAAARGRTPTLLEITTALEIDRSSMLRRWRGRRAKKRPMPFASLNRRFYRMAGLTPRPFGAGGRVGIHEKKGTL